MKIILSGIGKIARDQHIPAISDSTDWTLAGTHSRNTSGQLEGVPFHTDLGDAIAAHPEVDIYSLCQPPEPRFALAKQLILAGKHVMLEKPPGASLAEIYELRDLAAAQNVILFATWHSRMAPGVRAAKNWLADKDLKGGHITWREDVRRWHPGQDWVFDPGGMGVFDPGINALSILTHILPFQVHLQKSNLLVPENRAMPIAADLQFNRDFTADFDWRQEGPQTWEIRVSTDAGELKLIDGGGRLTINGVEQPVDALGEYPAIYAHMAELIRTGQSDVDLAPLVHVADAFMLGARESVAAFHY